MSNLAEIYIAVLLGITVCFSIYFQWPKKLTESTWRIKDTFWAWRRVARTSHISSRLQSLLLIATLILASSIPFANVKANVQANADNDNMDAIAATNKENQDSTKPKNLDTAEELNTFQRAVAKAEAAGPYNPELSEMYYGMGLHLQRSDQHDAAIKLFSQAMHIERINQGIYSLAQSPALRGIINSRKALNQVEETTADYYRLLWLHRKNSTTSGSAMIPVLVELNRWHLTAYQFDDSAERIDHLTTANNLISQAVTLAEQPDIQSTLTAKTLHNLLRNVALTSFFLARHQGDDWSSSHDSRFSFSTPDELDTLPMRTAVLSKASYARGLRAHQTIVAMIENDEHSTFEQRIQSYTELGDWYLSFGKQDHAYTAYRQAIALIPQAQQPLALSKQLFNRPIMLPAVRNETPEIETSNGTRDTMARIQADISARGWASRVEILSPGKTENKRLRRRAISAIRAARFRPRFVNGEALASQGEIIHFPLIQ